MLRRDRAWTADLPQGGFAHGGLTIGPAGELIAADADGTTLHVLDADGAVTRRIETGVTEAHGLSVTTLGGRPAVLVADPGFRLVARGSGAEKDGPGTGIVVALDLATGERILELNPPPAHLYADAPYRPTFAASDLAAGGDGEIWVADGYGASLLHRYSGGGTYLGTLDGEGGAGRFDCPHAIHLEGRGGEPRLYVADRNPRRVQVYDLDGRFERSFGIPQLTSPSGFARLDEAHLVVAELRARLVVVDEHDDVRWVVGADEAVVERPGWPNRLDDAGDLVPPEPIAPDVFNSPHAIASDGAGTLFVSEFVLGGRFSRWVLDGDA